jgi:phage host-nuclease inhibitor protein Gam
MALVVGAMSADQAPIPEFDEPFPEDYLDEYLDPESDPLGIGASTEQVERFSRIRQFAPQTDVDAEKVMRRLVAAHHRRKQIIDQADELIAPIEAWRDSQLVPWERRIAWFTDHLRQYAILRRFHLGERDPQAKTLRLPSGDVPTRRVDRRVEVVDPAAFITWAQANDYDTLVRIPTPPPEVAVNAVKKAVMIVEKDGKLLPVLNGEEVPGLTVYDVDVTAEPKPVL